MSMVIARVFTAAMIASAALSGMAGAERLLTRSGLPADGTAERFEVFTRAGAGPGEIFCAAGDFARSRLGARANDRVEVVSGPGASMMRSRQRSVVFALRPPGSARARGGLDVLFLRPSQVGNSRSVAQAILICESLGRRADGDDES